MAIVVTIEVPGMTKESYEQSMREFGDAVKEAPGFVVHASGPTANGYAVTEIWESQEDWDRWMSGTIMPAAERLDLRPNPPDIRQVESVISAR